MRNKSNFILKFYHSKEWKNKRKYILSRDFYLCMECKKYGRTQEANTIHHIIPLINFENRLLKKEITFDEFFLLALDENNLESLCHGCHNHKHPEKGYLRKN